ncbi:transmembrane protein 91-like [Sphaerodactylus townsendi]|uniref:Uncharacterized protein n=1 Tax=Sphaerodactylus townsendi TaxID=933632 RepID=A0ACB8FRI3_9SAUR|nr:transmembrane protein 91-like [Sphaerodactylus townsendi]
MENPNYENNQSGAPPSLNPPPYSEKEQQPPVDGPAPTTSFTANPTMPQQSQPYYGQYGIPPGQGFIAQPLQHTTLIIPVQPTQEPDYLVYSIFTMLCCCLPLGIAALVYSVQTRDANRIGDANAARQSSRMAQIFAHTALATGLVFLVVYIVLTTVVF